ncbi:hypothetical protein [Sphingopyxis panaciterrulae]|uniref:Uncharacterized protein n=1 Tax=Sphingopyxis panaciterrulae TaxID=462372 RepID=A0A7W9B3J8_9SPHN|nr:hypothetical protein [Sphingopyxis panaciterrulae]MBB5705596.1 hypothetical protein [Sphingopyxis panaciterrulae]
MMMIEPFTPGNIADIRIAIPRYPAARLGGAAKAPARRQSL